MKISKQLLKPLIDRIEEEYLELFNEVSGSSSDEARSLRSALQQKRRQVEMASVSLLYVDRGARDYDTEHLRTRLRQLKLDLRFAQRKWKRYLVSEERIRKTLERRSHVATVAA